MTGGAERLLSSQSLLCSESLHGKFRISANLQFQLPSLKLLTSIFHENIGGMFRQTDAFACFMKGQHHA